MTYFREMDEFVKDCVEHTNFLYCYDRLAAHIQYHTRGALYVVIGPTGVGKTALLNYVKDEIEEHYAKYNPNILMPVIAVEAPAPEKGVFNWADFYQITLKAMEEPLLESKTELVHELEYLQENGKLKPNVSKLSIAKTKSLLIDGLNHRKVKVWLIDEAAQFRKGAKKKTSLTISMCYVHSQIKRMLRLFCLVRVS